MLFSTNTIYIVIIIFYLTFKCCQFRIHNCLHKYNNNRVNNYNHYLYKLYYFNIIAFIYYLFRIKILLDNV